MTQPDPDEQPETRTEASSTDRFDLEVFDQATTWVDRAGTSHDIAAMTSFERCELRGWLLAHARHFYLHVLTRDLFAFWPAGLRDIPHRAPPLLYLSAEQWLIGTPLFQALDA